MRHRDTRPLPEAYSRVTNPERFLPLHGLALALIEQLRNDFKVEAQSTFELMPGRMQPFTPAREPVTLIPASPDAAPLSVAFTPFPSLLVRCGRWTATSFPLCGCHACGETAAGEGTRFQELVRDVVAGHFTEELKIPWLGRASLRWSLGSPTSGNGYHGGGTTILSRGQARILGAGQTGEMRWRPWPLRL